MVGRQVAADAKRYLDANLPVGECLADQLLLPLALAGGGSYRTLPLSMHSRTNIETIRKFLPEGVDESAVRELAAIGEMLGEVDRAVLEFDPFLVRGMGYYTGTIFEVTHPEFGYSLGGGGRYDGMIGRFLGTDVAAAGFSLGFERLVDLVDLPDVLGADATALLYDDSVAPATLLALKSELIAAGKRVRLERSTKNTRVLLDQLASQGFKRVATVKADTTTADDLQWRELGAATN